MTKSASAAPATDDLTNEFDLGSMDVVAAAARGAELELRHPSTGVYTGIFLTVLGADSKTFQASQRRIMDLAQKDGRKNVDVSVYERRAAELAASITTGWAYEKKSKDGETKVRIEGKIPWSGQELEFNDEAAVDVYLERRWIREQVEAFISVRENFFPG